MIFREAIDELFKQQRARLESSLDDASRIDQAFEALVEQGLDATSIDKSLCAELKLVLVRRYEHPIASTRLEGYGWTVAHVKDHMRRLLKSKMQQAGALMRSIVMNGEHEVMEEALDDDEPENSGKRARLDDLEVRLSDMLNDDD